MFPNTFIFLQLHSNRIEVRNVGRMRGIYPSFPSFHIFPPLPHFTKNFHHDFSFASVSLYAEVFRRKSGVAHSSATLSSAFFLSLNRAHSPRPVLNGARPWNRVRGHSSCLPRFIPAFGRRAVLLFPLRGIEPAIITRHHFCSDYLRCLANRHGNRSRIESVGSVRKDDRDKKIRFGGEWGAKRVGLDDVSASVLDTRGKRTNSFRFRISTR